MEMMEISEKKEKKRMLLTLRFEGGGFCGWQAQSHGNSIQQTVQDAAQSVFGERPGVSGCGRTDAGVHAYGYCCHLDIKKDFPTERLANALNRYFISKRISISVIEAREVPPEFHSRYCIKSKEYMYKIQNNAYRDPFYVGRAHYYHKPLDLGLMREAAGHILGEHNFSSFMGDKSDIPPAEATRTVHKIEIKEKIEDGAHIVEIYIAASGFLYKMARIIAGTLLEVSEKRIAPGDLPKIIAAQSRHRAGRTLPPCGLYLNKI
ncbi:MAG: tRNA pseudouridine(38-40) synthase TruA, partial [Oscillospiraceae bacterium]|nr:tRNA pseudouridine(38-40) synthase TruA [Oscillospiraceae bacterium]